ncbi:MAG: deoxyribose-phosphate aldolase [Candidatus Pacebacteria bacterium]|nr:deoxyribose-phosphate aldolase [Candidatus Paceibacterota bacterium]
MQPNTAKLIDQTFLKKGALEQEIKKVCQETREYGFRGLCVYPEHTKLAKESLLDSDVKVTTLIDEPTGASPHEIRMKKVLRAKEDWSDEVDVVMKIDDFKNGKYDEVLSDLKEICAVLPTKVIIGSGYLTDEEIKKASEIVKEARAICVKTATVEDPLDHSELAEKAKHVRIMRESAPGILVKVAGFIRTLADLEMMIKAGADIIGTSSGVEIVNEEKGKDISAKEDWRKTE